MPASWTFHYISVNQIVLIMCSTDICWLSECVCGVCTCVPLCTCICVYVCMHVYMYEFMYMYLHMFVYVYMHLCVVVCICMFYMKLYVCVSACLSVRAPVFILVSFSEHLRLFYLWVPFFWEMFAERFL